MTIERAMIAGALIGLVPFVASWFLTTRGVNWVVAVVVAFLFGYPIGLAIVGLLQ